MRKWIENLMSKVTFTCLLMLGAGDSIQAYTQVAENSPSSSSSSYCCWKSSWLILVGMPKRIQQLMFPLLQLVSCSWCSSCGSSCCLLLLLRTLPDVALISTLRPSTTISRPDPGLPRAMDTRCTHAFAKEAKGNEPPAVQHLNYIRRQH